VVIAETRVANHSFCLALPSSSCFFLFILTSCHFDYQIGKHTIATQLSINGSPRKSIILSKTTQGENCTVRVPMALYNHGVTSRTDCSTSLSLSAVSNRPLMTILQSTLGIQRQVFSNMESLATWKRGTSCASSRFRESSANFAFP
jgi:hypothetical protein